MIIDTAGKVTYLKGDWTIINLSKDKVESLADALHTQEPGLSKMVMVDCRNVTAIDRAGLELLHTWLHCAEMYGFKPVLINLPARLEQPLKMLAVRTENGELAHNMGKQRRRRSEDDQDSHKKISGSACR